MKQRRKMSLEKYQKKRKFNKTSEPKGDEQKASSKEKIFVVQEHHSRALHFDFRIEHRGVLISFAVPKGISLDPGQKHFAKHVEDHPIEYASFEGVIPKGNYGAGTVKIWDQGSYIAGFDPQNSEVYLDAGLKNGHFDVTLLGKKLKGTFILARLKEDDWIIFKKKDKYAKPAVSN